MDINNNITPDDSNPIYDPRDIFGEKYMLPIKFGIEMLDIFCSYVTDIDNESISHSSLENTKTLFEIMDKRYYMNNDSLKARLEYIELALKARIELYLDKKSLVIEYVTMNCDPQCKDIIENEIIKGPVKSSVNINTTKYINDLVYENLSEGYSVSYNQKLMSLFDKKESGYFKSLSEYTEYFENLMNEIMTNIQTIKRYKIDREGFDLSKQNILRKAKKIYRNITKPSNKLKTGIQYLNRMLNGGFEAGRSYLFVGITGVGKSVILLSVANWIRKFNKLPKRNGMKQAVLFISQENSETETFERLFNIDVSNADMRDLTEDEFVNMIEKSELMVSDEDINFIFKEYDDREIGVSDIDALINDYERNGIEIIAVVQDYIEKLKPKFKYNELRHALGGLGTELSALAKKRKIPVISAAQMNRAALSIVDNAIANNKKNTTKLLGKQNISESWDMMKNVDAVILINKEIDDTSDIEKQYMGFKLEKFRGKPGKNRVYLFLHPFAEDNGILLIPDMDTKPLSRSRMEDFEPMRNPEVSSKHVSFTDDMDFRSNIIDIIDDDYKDSSKHYVDILNKAEEVSNKMRLLHEREKEIKRQREIELKNGTYDTNENNEIVISSRKPMMKYNEDGLIIIESRSKLIKNDNLIVIEERKKKIGFE